jgi:L-ascorbate metabolism protein UlaG (beta-lactamase superfamily)
LVLIASTDWLAALGARATGARLERMRRSPNYSEDHFKNKVPTDQLKPGTTWETIERQLFGDEQRTPARPVTLVQRTRADYETPPESGLRVTWMGHATVLAEIEGKRLLFDPMWSDRASPSTLVGPRRLHPPPLALEDLPPIDAVLISHDHFDHCDMATVRALATKADLPFVVPLGVGAHLERWGIGAERIVELDWNETATVAGMRVVATPARHFSGRSIGDGDATLWASWCVLAKNRRLYFSGDTGYFDAFARIGELYGPFDLTMIKIGAYGETWPEIHVTPEEAIQAHVDLRGGVLVPIHWATFNLAFHAWAEPGERLRATAEQRGVDLALPRPGELVDVGGPRPSTAWWR